MEIHCRGPFRFDVLRRVATFRDGVDVMKMNPSGPADQTRLRVALDLLHRARRGSRADPGGSLDLVAQRLEARGNPVVVTAPSRNLNARGPRIEYNLLTESIALDGAGTVQFVARRRSAWHVFARRCFSSKAPTKSTPAA